MSSLPLPVSLIAMVILLLVQGTHLRQLNAIYGVNTGGECETASSSSQHNNASKPVDQNTAESFDQNIYSCNRCNNLDLRRYIPRAIIGGVQKGGTTSLSSALELSENIGWGGREAHILFKGTQGQGNENSTTIIDQCQIWKAYKDFFEEEASKNADMKFIDKTPRYLFHSDMIPHHMKCAVPKEMMKIIFVVRDPADRAYSHYQMIERKYSWFKKGTSKNTKDLNKIKIGGNGTFEAALQDSFDVIEESGFYKAQTPREILEAWGYITHTKTPSQSILSRGFYALQLQMFIDKLSSYVGGTDELFSNHLLIFENDDMKTNYQQTMDKVNEFIGMPHVEMPQEGVGKTPFYDTMENSTRAMLVDFYRPYNAALHDLLRPYGIEISFAKKAWEESQS